MHWFTIGWWEYLLAAPRSFRAFLCRAGGHKCGVVWYTSDPEATEPDMHCRNCNDDLR